MLRILLLTIITFAITKDLFAQQRQGGPVIEGYGEVFTVPNPEFKTDSDKVYKVVFDIYNTPEDPTLVNPQLNTLARFLNMHAQAGVPLENLKVAAVFHNKASHDVLNNKGYKERYGTDNPNEPLLKALGEAGADIYICGQSVYARGVDREQLAAPVQVALSAMTVILSLQAEGYTLIKF
jgi:intracellular sulfur oxidation DsrE/DsrF family protein